MHPQDLLEALLELAEGAGITVRVLPRGDSDLPARSGACRMHGEPWLLLSPTEGVEDRIAAAAQAIRQFAPAAVEGWLPPAVRARIEAVSPGGS